MNWHKIACTRQDLCLGTLLTCGQSFTWHQTSPGIWCKAFNGRIVNLSQDDSSLLWSVTTSNNNLPKKNTATTATDDDDSQSFELAIRDYFQLKVDLPSLYAKWGSADPNFKTVAEVEAFQGIRILRQDPIENLFSFICSTNNHVSRIANMVNKLCSHYGLPLGSVNETEFYTFPSVDALCQPGVEETLRQTGFGYRAKFIAKSAEMIKAKGAGWLEGLRTAPYEQCIAELTTLCGVGRKVADCVALMSLDKAHVVPVDTHVLQIAIRDYKITGITKELKSLTPAVHNTIGKFFVDLYGEYAGWAHTVLFAADLKKFSDKRPNSPKKPREANIRKPSFEVKGELKVKAETEFVKSETVTESAGRLLRKRAKPEPTGLSKKKA